MNRPRRVVAARMGEAAAELLASLDPQQQTLAAWPFPGDEERRLWFYTPTDHGGLPLAAMRSGQQRLALRLVASGLSRPGYVTVSAIMGLENVLDELEGWAATFERERGRDPGLYYLRVFGDPISDAAWSWRFGGHHVSINHVIIDGEVQASTPCFLGADPASSPLLGPHPLRPLAGAEDLGRELVRSLDAAQRAQAVLSPVAPVDIVGANRPRLAEGDLPMALPDVWRSRFTGELGERLEAVQANAEQTAGLKPEHLEAVRFSRAPKGVSAGLLDASQKEMLRRLLGVYVDRIAEELADLEAAKFAGSHLDEVHFAWAGGTEPGEPHYYRMQGPRFLAEYDNTQRGASHIHTVWRDPDGDFADDLLAHHYRTSPHHG